MSVASISPIPASRPYVTPIWKFQTGMSKLILDLRITCYKEPYGSSRTLVCIKLIQAVDTIVALTNHP
jgi:hypothetical protein